MQSLGISPSLLDLGQQGGQSDQCIVTSDKAMKAVNEVIELPAGVNIGIHLLLRPLRHYRQDMTL